MQPLPPENPDYPNRLNLLVEQHADAVRIEAKLDALTEAVATLRDLVETTLAAALNAQSPAE